MRAPKFIRGKRLETLDQVAQCFQARRWIYLGNVPKHPAWLFNMSLQIVSRYIAGGRLYAAEENPEFKVPKRPDYFKTSVAQCLKKPIDISDLECLLLLVDVTITREELAKLTPLQRAIAEDWASRVHLSASDNPVRVPQRPKFLPEKAAGLLLPPESAQTSTLKDLLCHANAS